jgi:hypothetical protein
MSATPTPEDMQWARELLGHDHQPPCPYDDGNDYGCSCFLVPKVAAALAEARDEGYHLGAGEEHARWCDPERCCCE